MNWKSLLGGIAPVLSTALSIAVPGGGALAGQALMAVSNAVLGKPNGSADEVAAALQKGLPPDTVLALKKADDDFQVQMAQQMTAQGQQRVDNAAAINVTMQTEAKADHWPTYSWRPFIGFCFGALGLATGGTVAGSYFGVIFFHQDPAMLATIPAMLSAEALIMTTMAAPLGIASWFRGKMQVNPAVPSDPRG